MGKQRSILDKTQLFRFELKMKTEIDHPIHKRVAREQLVTERAWILSFHLSTSVSDNLFEVMAPVYTKKTLKLKFQEELIFFELHL